MKKHSQGTAIALVAMAISLPSPVFAANLEAQTRDYMMKNCQDNLKVAADIQKAFCDCYTKDISPKVLAGHQNKTITKENWNGKIMALTLDSTRKCMAEVSKAKFSKYCLETEPKEKHKDINDFCGCVSSKVADSMAEETVQSFQGKSDRSTLDARTSKMVADSINSCKD